MVGQQILLVLLSDPFELVPEIPRLRLFLDFVVQLFEEDHLSEPLGLVVADLIG
jgi:hypothetical protein